MSLWLSRELVRGPHLALCTSEDDYKRACAALRVKPRREWLIAGSAACMHEFQRDGGNPACVVSIRPTEDGISAASSLMHEAVHVWQVYREWINESSPSTEFEAYAIQNIAETLMREYARRVHA